MVRTWLSHRAVTPARLFALHPRHFSYIYQRYMVGRMYIDVVNRLLKLGVTDTQGRFQVLPGRGRAADLQPHDAVRLRV